ncbi:MAG: hypothetical protein KDE27_18050 [Planctomycetes bacterium]|nr:hypothetical protein [Planctomycetota bacterium]
MSASLASTLAAQDLQLAVDINQIATPFSSIPDAGSPDDFVLAGGKAFFRATHPAFGRELWVTDGTAAGTILLQDIVPGVGSSGPLPYLNEDRHEIGTASIGGAPRILFSAQSVSEGNEPWISDGTPAGTRLLLDINPGPEGSSPNEFTAFHGKVYFVASEPGTGLELWESDGTAAGTLLAADVFAGPSSSVPAHLHVLPGGGALLFQARSPSFGYDLYSYDPVAGTATRLAVLNASSFNGPRDFHDVGGRTLFSSWSATTGQELWVTDGSAAGTQVIDLVPGPGDSTPRLDDAIVLGSTLYFAATTAAAGTELWSSDGTAAGTQLVADIVPGAGSSTPKALANLGGVLAFAAETPATGREPWVLIGSAATLVADLEPGAVSSNPSQFALVGSQTLFAATIGSTTGLFRFGAGQLTLLAAATVRGMTAFGAGRWLFRGNASQGREPWITDGTVAGTNMILDVGAGQTTASSTPIGIQATSDGALFFGASDGFTGHEPWVWKPGSTPQQLADIEPGASASYPQLLAQTEHWSLLHGQATGLGREPYAWHHQQGTVTLLADINPGAAGSDPVDAVAIGDDILFVARDPAHGAELWLSDGTPGGTALLMDIDPGSGSSWPGYFTPYRGKVLFNARTLAGGAELWVTDGTAAGTMMLVDIAPGPSGSDPRIEAEYDGDLWFAATTPQFGRELWRTDGTVAGTVLAVDVEPGAVGSFPNGLVRLGDRLVFVARTPATGYELFATDGTVAGTSLVKDIRPGPQGGCTYSVPVAAGSQVFLRADDGVAGLELWVSDLTAAGTRLVRDLSPTSNSGSLHGIPIAIGERLYFGASTFDRPNSVWASDGTAAGTVPLGLGTGSAVLDAAALDGVLYARLVDLVGGNELVAITDPGAMVEDLGDRCASNWSRIDATPPVLGGAMTVAGEGAPNASVGFTAAAFAAPRQQLPGILAADCWSRALPPFAVLPPTLTPDWQLPIAVPATASLSGVGFVLQSFYLSSLNPLIEPSNAIRVTIGR